MPKRNTSMTFRFFILSVFIIGLYSCKDPLPTHKLYHLVEIDFEGPSISEDSDDNPFTNYRLDVTFTSGSKNLVVPGFYAADGQAHETSASRGNVWRVRFSPPSNGKWKYRAVFFNGPEAHMSNKTDLAEISLSQPNGAFNVIESFDDSKDLTNKGPLHYDGSRYLKWKQNKQPYIKGGANSPENLLAYEDFDGTYSYDTTKQFIKDWAPHIKDWKVGDPTWQGEKGKGIIGALNYLSDQGMNVVYFLSMNIAGDGCDVWPYSSHEDFSRFDVSKLAQWDIVFRHAQKLGIVIQFVLQETENETLLDNGNTGPVRQLYFRELVARFGYHNGLLWNLGEENGPAKWSPIAQNNQQRKDMCEWFDQNDPFNNPVLLHTHSWHVLRDSIIDPLLGFDKLDGLSVQIDNPVLVHDEFVRNYERSKKAGHTWVQHMDEIGWYWQGAKPDADDPTHDTMRVQVLWGNLMGGGAGAEWYFGYKYAEGDLVCEDWRSRAELWRQTHNAMVFFEELPVLEMDPSDNLVEQGHWSLSKPNSIYAIYIPKWENHASLDLSEANGQFELWWYHPTKGGELRVGTIENVNGGGIVDLGQPPQDISLDWAVLVRRKDV